VLCGVSSYEWVDGPEAAHGRRAVDPLIV
jgi:hypothetical protein